MKSPLATLKEKFGDKAKLVAELEKLTTNEDLWVNRVNQNKGLAHVSNAKLLKLQATFAAVTAKFGTRAKMIDAICELEKRAKDEGFKTRLGAYPVPRLWDMFRSAEKRSNAAAKIAAGERVKRGPKKVVVKKVAAPKAAASKKKLGKKKKKK
jgi:hypothetical protein